MIEKGAKSRLAIGVDCIVLDKMQRVAPKRAWYALDTGKTLEMCGGIQLSQ